VKLLPMKRILVGAICIIFLSHGLDERAPVFSPKIPTATQGFGI
jgi:hypothetical protein